MPKNKKKTKPRSEAKGALKAFREKVNYEELQGDCKKSKETLETDVARIKLVLDAKKTSSDELTTFLEEQEAHKFGVLRTILASDSKTALKLFVSIFSSKSLTADQFVLFLLGPIQYRDEVLAYANMFCDPRTIKVYELYLQKAMKSQKILISEFQSIVDLGQRNIQAAIPYYFYYGLLSEDLDKLQNALLHVEELLMKTDQLDLFKKLLQTEVSEYTPLQCLEGIGNKEMIEAYKKTINPSSALSVLTGADALAELKGAAGFQALSIDSVEDLRKLPGFLMQSAAASSAEVDQSALAKLIEDELSRRASRPPLAAPPTKLLEAVPEPKASLLNDMLSEIILGDRKEGRRGKGGRKEILKDVSGLDALSTDMAAYIASHDKAKIEELFKPKREASQALSSVLASKDASKLLSYIKLIYLTHKQGLLEDKDTQALLLRKVNGLPMLRAMLDFEDVNKLGLVPLYLDIVKVVFADKSFEAQIKDQLGDPALKAEKKSSKKRTKAMNEVLAKLERLVDAGVSFSDIASLDNLRLLQSAMLSSDERLVPWAFRELRIAGIKTDIEYLVRSDKDPIALMRYALTTGHATGVSGWLSKIAEVVRDADDAAIKDVYAQLLLGTEESRPTTYCSERRDTMIDVYLNALMDAYISKIVSDEDYEAALLPMQGKTLQSPGSQKLLTEVFQKIKKKEVELEVDTPMSSMVDVEHKRKRLPSDAEESSTTSQGTVTDESQSEPESLVHRAAPSGGVKTILRRPTLPEGKQFVVGPRQGARHSDRKRRGHRSRKGASTARVLDGLSLSSASGHAASVSEELRSLSTTSYSSSSAAFSPSTSFDSPSASESLSLLSLLSSSRRPLDKKTDETFLHKAPITANLLEAIRNTPYETLVAAKVRLSTIFKMITSGNSIFLKELVNQPIASSGKTILNFALAEGFDDCLGSIFDFLDEAVEGGWVKYEKIFSDKSLSGALNKAIEGGKSTNVDAFLKKYLKELGVDKLREFGKTITVPEASLERLIEDTATAGAGCSK